MSVINDNLIFGTCNVFRKIGIKYLASYSIPLCRKMVYEYESVRSKEDKAKKLQPVVSIEIPFGTIVG